MRQLFGRPWRHREEHRAREVVVNMSKYPTRRPLLLPSSLSSRLGLVRGEMSGRRAARIKAESRPAAGLSD